MTTTLTPVPALLTAVEARQGVARVPSLIAAGYSRYWIGQALDSGRLQRVRRGWVALPGTDPKLVAAARGGVVLTCITAARRHGLWVLREDGCDVAASPHATGGKPRRATVHWAQPVAPCDPDQLVDRIENTLALVAACQPFEAALAVWESALQKGVVDARALARLDLPASARAIADAATPYSGSGLETVFRWRLRWLGVAIRPQVVLLDRPVDFLLGDRLVVQIDGGHHVGRQRASDLAHDAQLALRGFHVLRFTYAQIIDEWPRSQDTIMRAVAAGLHLAR